MNSKKPSITELCSMLDKPFLLKWANSIGLKGIDLDSFRKESMKKGTSLHKQIENYQKNNTPFEDKNFFSNYIEFMKDKEIICFEKQIQNDFYNGRLDIKYKHNGLLYLCDFKTGHKNLYFENYLQLCGYGMEEQYDKLAIISIPDFKIIELNSENHKKYQQILIYLSQIYKLKNEINENNN